MYGLLLENLAEYIRIEYGEEKWEEIRRLANVDQPTFSTHRVYSDLVIPKLASKAAKVLHISENEIYENMGRIFVGFVGQYGYDRVLSILGRHMRDFLNGLDNLHEYLKFSYPRMKAPSFFCENENQYGLTLHYRSKRKGYMYYTMGQIKEVGRRFYGTDVRIAILKVELLFDTNHVTFQLHFENTAYLRTSSIRGATYLDPLLPIQSQLFFEIFPFCIVFGSDMVIRNIGHSLRAVLPDLVGKRVTEAFNLSRPLIDFTWKTVLLRTNNIFELVTLEPLKKNKSEELMGNTCNSSSASAKSGQDSDNEDFDEIDKQASCLSLKGQMLYMDEWKSIIFLGTPMMQDLDAMFNAGLYINDLSMHDFSRDLMLAGTQQSVELKLALDQEQQKSKRLEESMKKLDEEMKRTDELLYQMIPKAVADRLRRGVPAVSTCEVFESVTILFSDVVTFTQICSRIAPMEVVSLLNSMYSIFDKLTSRHQVYKVETIGDAYMVVSGTPEKRDNHAEKVCDMALDMMTGITGLKDPSTNDTIRIRIGIHSGTIVAGVVGLKMPRYCLFGDSVNTASRMESTSKPMKIHISESTFELLHSRDYEIDERGTIAVKGKGNMKTYWLKRRVKMDRLDAALDVDESGSRSSCTPSSNQQSRSSSPEGRFSPGVRSLYSPVTLDEVKRHRQMSPVRQHANTWTTPSREKDVAEEASPCRRPSAAAAAVTVAAAAIGILPPRHVQALDPEHCLAVNPFFGQGVREASGHPTTPRRQAASRQPKGDEVKPTAILFPCFNRSVAPVAEGAAVRDAAVAGDKPCVAEEVQEVSRRKAPAARSHFCAAF